MCEEMCRSDRFLQAEKVMQCVRMSRGLGDVFKGHVCVCVRARARACVCVLSLMYM